MNKLLKTATFTFAVIATINIFSACSKEENTPSINIDQLYQNINGSYVGTANMRNSENILDSKSTTWIAKKEIISVKNITGSELAGGVKDHSSKLYQALLNATNGKLEITMMSFRPQEQSIAFSTLAKLSFTINLDGQQIDVVGTGSSRPFACYYVMSTQEMFFSFTITDMKKSNGRGSFTPLSTDYNLPVTFEFDSHQKN